MEGFDQVSILEELQKTVITDYNSHMRQDSRVLAGKYIFKLVIYHVNV